MATPNLVFRGSYTMKTVFEAVLRASFTDTTIIQDERYRYTDDETTTKLQIYRSFPSRAPFFPSITISVSDFDASVLTLGIQQEQLDERVVNGQVIDSSFGGYLQIPVVLTIRAKESQDDRDLLRDYLIQILRILARSRFAAYGFGFRSITVTGDDQDEDSDGNVIYTASITILVDTDYGQFLTTPDGLIQSILVDVLGREFPNSTPVPLHEEPPFE